MSTIFRFLALSAMSGALGCCGGALDPPAAIGLYYSFDQSLPAEPFLEMQIELAHILRPTGITVEWRSLSLRPARPQTDDFPQIFVFRFRGTCSLDDASGGERAFLTRAGAPLAATQMTDHHILPYGDVDCGVLRRTVASAEVTCGLDNNLVMGRAMARVVAHELYHMLTGSPAHARSGIARAAFSPEDLTAEEFVFTWREIAWLRQWVLKQSLSGEVRAAN